MSAKNHLLIVEDDPDIMEVLNLIFEEEGFEVISNHRGLSTEEVAQVQPDLVILDIRISGFEKTGAQLCQELKTYERTRHVPILLMSAESNLTDLASQSGANGYIPKPFDINILLSKAQELVSSK